MRRILISSALMLLTASTVMAETSAKSALNKRQPSIKFTEIALSDAIEFFRDSTNANFSVDWKALEEVGISKETPVSLTLRYAKTRVALKNALEAAAPGLLTFYVEENVITITTQAKADDKMIVRTYPVQDLLVEIPDFQGPSLSLTDNVNGNSGGRRGGNNSNGGGSNNGIFGGSNNSSDRNKDDEKSKTRAERGQDLVDLIQTTVRPEVWDINGGKAKIKFFNGILIVTAPRSVQEAIGGPID